MSLHIEQLFVVSPSKDLFSALNKHNSNKFAQTSYYAQEDLNKLSDAEKYKLLKTDDAFIYKQNGASVLTVSNDSTELYADIDPEAISIDINSTVLWLVLDEGYNCELKVFENGECLLNILSGAENNPTIDWKVVGPKFAHLKDIEEDLSLYTHPTEVFQALGLDFFKLYDVDTHNLEEILFFREK
jgi:hypothetical protein